MLYLIWHMSVKAHCFGASQRVNTHLFVAFCGRMVFREAKFYLQAKFLERESSRIYFGVCSQFLNSQCFFFFFCHCLVHPLPLSSYVLLHPEWKAHVSWYYFHVVHIAHAYSHISFITTLAASLISVLLFYMLCTLFCCLSSFWNVWVRRTIGVLVSILQV